jgi:hypothetical protein
VKFRRHPVQKDAELRKAVPEDPGKEMLQFLFERRDKPAKELYELLIRVLRPETNRDSADGEREKHATVERFIRACKKLECRSVHRLMLRGVEWVIRKVAKESWWKIGWKHKRQFQKLATQLYALYALDLTEQRFHSILARPFKPTDVLIAELDPVEQLAAQVVKLSDRLPKNSETRKQLAWVILDIKRQQQMLFESNPRGKELYWAETIWDLRAAAQELRQEFCPPEFTTPEAKTTEQLPKGQEEKFAGETVIEPAGKAVGAKAV